MNLPMYPLHRLIIIGFHLWQDFPTTLFKLQISWPLISQRVFPRENDILLCSHKMMQHGTNTILLPNTQLISTLILFYFSDQDQAKPPSALGSDIYLASSDLEQ